MEQRVREAQREADEKSGKRQKKNFCAVKVKKKKESAKRKGKGSKRKGDEEEE